MKCYKCKKGELKMTEYKEKQYASNAKIRHTAKMVCDNCGHKELFS